MGQQYALERLRLHGRIAVDLTQVKPGGLDSDNPTTFLGAARRVRNFIKASPAFPTETPRFFFTIFPLF